MKSVVTVPAPGTKKGKRYLRPSENGNIPGITPPVARKRPTALEVTYYWPQPPKKKKRVVKKTVYLTDGTVITWTVSR